MIFSILKKFLFIMIENKLISVIGGNGFRKIFVNILLSKGYYVR